MAEGSSVEQPRLTVAERWMHIKGIKKPKPSGFLGRIKEGFRESEESKKTPESHIPEAYDLLAERDDLRNAIVREQRRLMEPVPKETPVKERWAKSQQALEEAGRRLQEGLTLEQKRQYIKSGRVEELTSGSFGGPSVEAVKQNQTRVEEIEQRLGQIFSVPGIYEKFQADLNKQIRIRNQASEAQTLERLGEQLDIATVRIAREAQVQGRTLTPVERQVVTDNQILKEEAQGRYAELLKDPDVFDRVRITELQEYRHQLERRNGRFAVTPSRQTYVDKLEKWWANNNHVLLTGATGTGKTELVRYAAEKLFDKLPFKIPGDPEMNIYRLLGTTGLKVEKDSGSDVPRYSELLLAMGVEGGDGGPVLYDEIDATPNRANLAIKELLNRVPRQKVREDVGHKAFTVGKDYCLAATANVLGEKHPDRYPIGDEIVRVFRPMDIDYMPAYEVYDLVLATLMDKRGGIPLTENDARVLLKNLCDAASWIQDAYQGRKVITDPGSGAFLPVKGQASTEKAASLKKALLDPGRTLDMLRGWTAAQISGISFEDYMNERILEFINNRAYPDEDRYYLAEIFALKGFLKGRKASELMVAGLTQDTLDRWSGATSKREATKGAVAHLSADRVAKLDPYRRFKRPASADAEDLLAEEEGGEALGTPKSVTSEKLRQLQAIIGDITKTDTGKNTHVAYLEKLREIGLQSTSLDEKRQATVLLEDYSKRGAFNRMSNIPGEVDRWTSLTSHALTKAGEIRTAVISSSNDLKIIREFVGDITIQGDKETHHAFITRVHRIGMQTASSELAEKAIELLDEYANKGVFNRMSDIPGEVDRRTSLTGQSARLASEIRAKIVSSV